MNKLIKNSLGLAQIPLMIMLLLMAIAVPVATKLVQDNADSRNQAASNACEGSNNASACSGQKDGDRCKGFAGTCELQGKFGCACVADKAAPPSGGGGGTQTCGSVTNPTECAYIPGCNWNGSSCSGVYPTATVCNVGAKECIGTNVRVCNKLSNGSTVWQSQFCPNGCSGNGVCNTEPTAVNAKCNTGNGWAGVCTTNANCNQSKVGVEFDIGGCGGGLGCCGEQPSTANAKCNTGNGWAGTCTTNANCNQSKFGVEFDIGGCGGGLGCCGEQPSTANAKCVTGNGWEGSCTLNANCNQSKVGIEFDIGGCGGGFGCCGVQPGSGTSIVPTISVVNPGQGIACNTTQGWPGTCTVNANCNQAKTGVAFDIAGCGAGLGCCGVQPGSGTSTATTTPIVSNPKATIVPTTPPVTYNPPGNPVSTTKPSGGNNGGDNNSGSTPVSGCSEQCPGTDGVLRNCTGTVGQSLCNLANRAEMCGGSCFVCPSVDGAWTKQSDLSKCSVTPTLIAGQSPILNYKVAFGGVVPSASQCVVDWPLQFIVLGGGESKAYTNIIPPTKTTVGSKLQFSGSLILTGFTKTTNIAAFIKGPKHLQVKYGINNQNSAYNKAGGELTLTTDASTSPIYDFTNFPIVPGDVVGTNSDNGPDGWINGVDFAYVKSKSIAHESVDVGGYLKGDLDGNCQVNSNDVNLLKISLQEKQEQLY